MRQGGKWEKGTGGVENIWGICGEKGKKGTHRGTLKQGWGIGEASIGDEVKLVLGGGGRTAEGSQLKGDRKGATGNPTPPGKGRSR